MALFIGEEIAFKKQIPSTMSDEELDKTYRQSNGRLIIDQGRYPIDQLVKMFEQEGRLQDDPIYQRGNVWDSKRKSKLIESLIMNVPVPPIYLFEKDYNQYEILDGKQRINSIVEFYSNDFELEGLDVWPGLNGKRFEDLTPTFKSALNRSYISSIIIMKESSCAAENDFLVRTIFERLNSGGVALTTQESRNALLAGRFNDMCKEIVSLDLFKEFWGLNKKVVAISLFGNNKIDDPNTILINYSEYPLRFFAYRQINNMESSLVSFLDEYLENANQFDDSLINKLKDLYVKTLSLALSLIGDNVSAKNINRNLYIYDPFMQALSCFLDKRDILLSNKTVFCNKFLSTIKDKQLFNGKYTQKNHVLKRIAKFKEIIEECL